MCARICFPSSCFNPKCNNVQGPYGNTYQQAQAVQANTNMKPQSEYPPSSAVQSFPSGQPQIPTSAPDSSLLAHSSSSGITITEDRSQQPLNVGKRVDDGYYWRKYGQKRVKGNKFPQIYYKCTCPGCPARKNVERSLSGKVSKTVYRDEHNHEPPNRGKKGSTTNLTGSSIHNNRGSSDLAASQFSSNRTKREQQEASSLLTTIEHMSEGSDSEEVNSGTGDDEPEPERDHRLRKLTEVQDSEPAAATSHRTVRESRVSFQMESEVDPLDDGYRWREYENKFVKGDPYSRYTRKNY